MELIIISGLSGAGKSHALQCMEDLGYYCVDNMPPGLLCDFVELCRGKGEMYEKTAFVMDVRGGRFFDDLAMALENLDAAGTSYKIMFLEASDTAIIRRYKETRRVHPLATAGNVEEGIRKEREKLADVRKRASFIIDTSEYKTSQLNAEIKRLLSVESADTFVLNVQSFGFKNGMPLEADWVLDVRFLPNPYYVPSLKELTGNNQKVKAYVMNCQEADRFAGRVTGTILDLIPSYIREGKYHLTIAIGCTGGRHRSVVIANEIAERLSECGRHANVKHRDL